MKIIFRCMLVVALIAFTVTTAVAQATREHKVQKKETMYGIAKMYGITVEQLVEANPGMEKPGYKLKKGSVIRIPVGAVQSPETAGQPVGQTIRMGIMLPLHDVNGDGKRMVEYYRGILMACDSLKKEGLSVDVRAWNVPENGDVKSTLQDPEAARCDLIVGPLYSKQVPALADFCESHNILLVIPFSIDAPDLFRNRSIFQVYQAPGELNESTARRCAEWFRDSHIVVVDCADSTSTKGPFTAALRRQLEVKDHRYSLTSLKSSDESFARALVLGKPNLVVLNTARSRDMITAMSRLKAIMAVNPTLQVSMFGYTEWLMYIPQQEENFYKYNVFIPAPFYTNLQTPEAERLQQKYRWNFHQDMMASLPRFAFTGFDHAMFFLRGLKKYGKSFDGAAGRLDYQPVQTPLKFERQGNGGQQNRSYMFIHYKPDHTIETVNY